MAEVIEVEIEQASEQEQRGREDEVVSVLSRLRPPVASDLSRKRKLVTNPGKGNRRSKSSSPNLTAAKSEPKSISAKDRAKEFKDEPFTAQANGGLFCTACRELVSLKKQNIHVHISSKKHKENKEKRLLNDKKDDDIRKAIAKYDDKNHPKGETLPSTTRLFRVKFVKAFLKSGTPLSRAEYFRDLFEEVGYPLTSSSNMRQLIPFILEQEYECICQEVKGKDVAIIFDGTTRDGEALVVLVRFVESWTIKQRLVRLRLLKSSVNGDELARIIIEVLHRKINIQENSLLAAMRDRASVNTKALQTVSVLYPDMIDIGCISHFLNKVGEKCHTPTLKLFMATWNLIFSTSIRARNIWRGISGRSMPRYNSTRWWSYWECAMVVLQEWQHIRTFLTSNEDFAKTSRQRLLQIFDVNTNKLKD